MQKRGFHPTFLLFEGTCVAEKNLAYSTRSFTLVRSQFFLGALLIFPGCAPSKKCFSINAH